MFVPLYDLNPTRSRPIVNYLLLAANLVAWGLELLLMGAWGPGVVTAGYGLLPLRLVRDPLGEAFTVLTSMFMHGSWAHLGGNLLFLYIFGDNVEETLGRRRYCLFYLACGAAAAAAQVIVDPLSRVPMVGASGAIAGVLGAYVVLHPRAAIVMLNTVLPLWLLTGPLVTFPAWMAIGMWFVLNLFGGLSSFGMGLGDGVAYFAHLGGFIAGLLLVRPSMRGRRRARTADWTGWHPPRRSHPRSDWRRSDAPHRDPWEPPGPWH
ncbi:rhomboid family intramembrane serine protease [Myxococcota bacterium]